MVLVDPGACWAARPLLAVATCAPASAPIRPAAGAPVQPACAPLAARRALRVHELTLRPALPADAPAQRALCEAMAPADFNLFGGGALSPGMLARARACGFQLLPAAVGTVELVMVLAADGAGRAASR